MGEVDGNLGRMWERDAMIHYETERGKTQRHGAGSRVWKGASALGHSIMHMPGT